MTKQKQKPRQTFKIDAKGRILGRLAVEIANILRGKNKVEYVPNLDVGDSELIYNVKDIVFTGRKLLQKKYYRHSTYPGGLKIETLKDVFFKNPGKVLFKAVSGMIPDNKLKNHMLKRLIIFPGEYDGQ